MDQLIAEWLDAGRAAGWSERTVLTYGWYVRRFAVWCGNRGVPTADQITRALLREWASYIRSDWGPATCKGAVAALRSYGAFLQREGVVDDLEGALRPVEAKGTIQRTISAAEFSALMGAAGMADRRGVASAVGVWLAVRDRAVLALLYDSMLRASELCALRVGDLRIVDQVLVVKRGKGGGARLAFFSASTAGELLTWLSLRGPVEAGAHLFITAAGGPLTARSLRQLVMRIGVRAGVVGVSPHAFRRGGAAAAVLAGCPGRLLQIAGGWSDMRMIEVYTRALEGELATRQAWLRYSPVTLANEVGC